MNAMLDPRMVAARILDAGTADQWHLPGKCHTRGTRRSKEQQRGLDEADAAAEGHRRRPR
jgi:hypothetical protein